MVFGARVRGVGTAVKARANLWMRAVPVMGVMPDMMRWLMMRDAILLCRQHLWSGGPGAQCILVHNAYLAGRHTILHVWANTSVAWSAAGSQCPGLHSESRQKRVQDIERGCCEDPQAWPLLSRCRAGCPSALCGHETGWRECTRLASGHRGRTWMRWKVSFDLKPVSDLQGLSIKGQHTLGVR